MFTGSKCSVLRGQLLQLATMLAFCAALLMMPSSTDAKWKGLIKGGDTQKEGSRAGLDVVVVQISNRAPLEDINTELEDAYTASSLWTALYCNTHGYTYKRIVDHRTHGPAATPLDGTWLKVPNLLPLLHAYDLVVLLDFDVLWSDLAVTLEEKLMEWKFDEHALVLQALDPDLPYNYLAGLDGVQQLMANSGFMIFRGKNTKVHRLVQLWSQCVEEVPGCDAFRINADQKAWNKYVRPHFGHHELIILPCSEANGYTGNTEEAECTGRFVSHYWLAKDQITGLVKAKLLRTVTTELTSLMMHSNAIEHCSD